MGSLLLVAAICTLPFEERHAAWADCVAQPVADQPYTRYLTLSAIPLGQRPLWSQAMKFAVPSASKELILDHQIPYRVEGTNLYRINLKRLGWSGKDWDKVIEKYPYSDQKYPLIVRADWLVYQLADTRDSDAYYRLLYGGASIPKTDADFLKFWGVDAAQQRGQQFGWVETKSQVSKQDVRYVERFNARGMALWRTKDVFKVERQTDPLENLDGNFKHDGRELIAQVPKLSLETGKRGALQVYMLANGQGGTVNEAPVRLVEDYGRTLGQSAIVNNSSCVTCHIRGMNFPTENGLKALITAGVELKTYDYDKQEAIEAFHLSDSAKELKRNCEDYETAVEACNGLSGPQNAQCYKFCLSDYLADIDLERAAAEAYTTPEELKLALSYASEKYAVLGNRLSGLVHGRTVPRNQWEQDYYSVQVYMQKWATK
jgi:hypothetical protein